MHIAPFLLHVGAPLVYHRRRAASFAPARHRVLTAARRRSISDRNLICHLTLRIPQTEGAAAPKSRSRETKRETALKTAVAHAEAELQHPDLMFLSEPRGARAPSLISEP